MKSFLLPSLVFLITTLLVTIMLIYVTNTMVDRGNFFALEPGQHQLIVGHSEAECAFNDTLMGGFINYAKSGESCFYTYFKTKKLLEENAQIKSVFISFSYVDITSGADEQIWGETVIANRYFRYCAFMGAKDIFFLLSKNWLAMLKAQSLALKNNASFLARNRSSYVKAFNWGGHLALQNIAADSILNAKDNSTIELTDTLDLSETNLLYLKKTIDLCESLHVPIYLVRSPLHKNLPSQAHEEVFQAVLRGKFSNQVFLDFKDFPLSNSEFADLEHLNAYGAKRFSVFFNQLVQKGVLRQQNPQRMVDLEMAKLNPVAQDGYAGLTPIRWY